MSDIKIFENEEFGQIRTLADECGEPLFVVKDVCAAFGVSNRNRTMQQIDDDEKGYTQMVTPGGNQQIQVVTEAGLYSLLFTLQPSKAKARGLSEEVIAARIEKLRKFKRWVTHEVLPSIRRDGGYMVAPEDEPPEVTMARALKIADEAIKRKDARIAEMRPKEVFADAVSASNQTILIGDLAKLLKQNGYDTGQKRLFAWLRDNGYLMKSGASVNMPTQRAMDMGLFRVKETAVTHSDGHVTLSKTTKVTGKGQEYFTNLFLGEGPLCEA